MHKSPLILVMTLIGCGGGAFAASPEAPFAFDSAPGRLPKDVVPERYAVSLTPHIGTLSIDGTESVSLRVRAATDRIVFNSLNETLSNVQLDGRSVLSVTSDDKQQLSTVKLAQPAAVGLHTLTFGFQAHIERQPQGMFLQPYAYPGGAPGQLLTTQFEATDARRMFPCWDEPAFRARFQLTVTVPARWATIGNMPIARRTTHGAMATVTFEPTPRMPAYLVEFTGGDLAALSGHSGATALGVWAVRGQEQQGSTALANAAQILADYNDYFAYPYPLSKLDSIAIPGGFSGAMENWGAITYQDQLLLLASSSTLGQRQEVFSTQAHEMAHQWNGDLVTMGWWDDLWLNESFASWMAAKETALRHPEWRWWEHEDDTREMALSADAIAGSPAIQRHIGDERQAANAADPEITYAKGQTILHMFEAFLGPDLFRDGIRRYLRARAFSNATSADLWLALDAASGKDMADIVGGWIRQPGFPLVKVETTCDASGARSIDLSQSRFLLSGTDTSHPRWSIPLQMRVGAHAAPRAILASAGRERIAAGRCEEPLGIDADALGYYRVEYDGATLRTDTQHFSEIPDGDRIALLDDQWALVLADVQPLPSYLSLAAAMGNDLDTRAWQQISAALDRIERAERGSRHHAAFTTYARSLVARAFQRLGWTPAADEGPDRQQLRRSLIRYLGAWNDPAVLAGAHERFERWLADRNSFTPGDRAAMLDVVAMHADTATFDQLRQLAAGAKDAVEMQRYYVTLAQVHAASLAQRALEIALSKSLPPQATQARFGMIATLADQHPLLAWRAYSEHPQELMGSYGPYMPLLIAQEIPEMFHDVPIDQLEAFEHAQLPAQMTPMIEEGMAKARLYRTQQATLAGEMNAFLAHH